MRVSPAETIEDLLQRAPVAERVLHRFGLDTCCSRRSPLKEACEKRGVPVDVVTAALAAALDTGARPESPPREAAAPVDPAESLRMIIARFQAARAVFDRHGLMNCGGEAGPDERLDFFAKAHHVPLEALLRDLRAATEAPLPDKAAPSEPRPPLAGPKAIPVAGQSAAPRSEPSGRFTPFLLAALGLTLTFGATLGMINLARLTTAWGWGNLTPPSIWMHAYVQVFGFVGLFIMGVAYHIIPRFAGTPLRAPGLVTPSFWLQLAGVVSIVCGFWLAPDAARVFWLVGGLALVAAATLFTWSIGQTLVAATPGPERFERWLLAGAVWLLVATGLVVVTALANDPTWHLVLWPVALYGFAANWIFGVGRRIFPIFLGLKPRWPQVESPAYVAHQLGVTLWAAGAWPGEGAAWLWLRAPGGVLLVVAATAYLSSLGAFRRDSASPMPVEPWYRGYILATWIWLAVGLIAGPLVSAVTLARGGYESVILLDFARHAVAFGFVTQTIMGVISRVLPVFTGNPLWSPRARTATFALLNLSVAVRGLEVVVVTGLWPEAWSLIALSGPPAVAAVVFFAANVAMTLRGPRGAVERTPVASDLADAPVLRLLDIPGALDLLVGAGFTPLANPMLRATLARNVTLRQACYLKGIPLPPMVEKIEGLRARAS
jgi:hypothetical protein